MIETRPLIRMPKLQESVIMTSKLTFRRTASLIALTSALALGGCASRSGMQAKTDFADVPEDHRERHSIVVGDVPQTIDVFLAANTGLDFRQASEVKAFYKDYRERGKGPLTASLPANAPAAAVQHTLREIRKHAPGIVVTSGPTHTTAASVRLSFAALDARVTSKCGQWPHDPAGGPTMQNWANRPYYNLGCSTQSMLAAQVANPIDHIRPREEGPFDLERRMKDIKEVRDGKDPSTDWKTQTSKINNALQ